MGLSSGSTYYFLFLVSLCTMLGREIFESNTEKNDVFLNFRGLDTRYGIISHLSVALRRRKVKTFIDSELPRGEELALLLKEIEASKVAVVVFSEDYASSSWCLDELVRIAERREVLRMKVLPIFYKIDSSDVLHQNGSFQAAFDRHHEDYKDNLCKVQRWRGALVEVSSLAGLSSKSNQRESDLVKKAADEVSELLRVSRLEQETGEWRAVVLLCIFVQAVILLRFKDKWIDLFNGGFISSVAATATILVFVFLGFSIRDHLVYLGTLDSYSDVLSFGILRGYPRLLPSKISVVIVILILLIGIRLGLDNTQKNGEQNADCEALATQVFAYDESSADGNASLHNDGDLGEVTMKS